MEKKSPEEERYEELTGGFLVSDDYITILEANGLNTIDGEIIRERVKKEIKQGLLTKDDIIGRLDYLIKEKSKIKGYNPRGYDLSILYPHISTNPLKHDEDLSSKTNDELKNMLPKYCYNCGNATGLYVFCIKCQTYIWNPISDELLRRTIDEYLELGETLDNEYHEKLTLVNEFKSKGFSIHSIFLSELCRFLFYLSITNNIISDSEIKFINEYLDLNLNKIQIINFTRTIDENYENELPLPFIIYHEIETVMENNIKTFYDIIGTLFISCDGKIDPKEKSKLIKYFKNLEKNIGELKTIRYESINITHEQKESIKIIDNIMNKNTIKTDICSKCGFENRPNVKFCTKCGNKMI